MKADEAIRRKRAALLALLNNHAGQMEGAAKRGAPWTDRTSHARQALHGGTEDRDRSIVVYLSHGVSYGGFLEQGTGLHGPKHRKYIIRPKNGRFLYWPGASHPVKEVNHPGMKPRPIIKPTMQAELPKIRRNVKRLLGGRS